MIEDSVHIAHKTVYAGRYDSMGLKQGTYLCFLLVFFVDSPFWDFPDPSSTSFTS